MEEFFPFFRHEAATLFMHFCRLEAHLVPCQYQLEASYAGKTSMPSIYELREPFSRRGGGLVMVLQLWLTSQLNSL